MAQQQNGYTIVPHATYDEFRQYALTHGVNVDFSWGNQCYDICALLWYQYGLRLQTGNGYAYGCWTLMRNQNAVLPFIQVADLNKVKRGDVVVFNHAGSFVTGHIAFADEDYNGSGRLRCLGQNQGQGSSSGTPSNVVNLYTNTFLGAFRNTSWNNVPPTPPTPTIKRENFPWVLYSRKLRQTR